jgi:hypothetical protein
LTLTVGLGANTALFGLVRGALRPLSVPDADRIVTIAAERKDDESGGFQYAFSLDALKDFQQRATSFSDVFGASLPRRHPTEHHMLLAVAGWSQSRTAAGRSSRCILRLTRRDTGDHRTDPAELESNRAVSTDSHPSLTRRTDPADT